MAKWGAGNMAKFLLLQLNILSKGEFRRSTIVLTRSKELESQIDATMRYTTHSFSVFMILLFETTTGVRMYLKRNMFHYIHLANIFV